MSILSKGSKGENVRKMQTALNRAGCTCTIDGHFGEETETALISFQIGNLLHVDGLCGSETWKALKPFMVDYSEVLKAAEKCLDAMEALPEYQALLNLLEG